MKIFNRKRSTLSHEPREERATTYQRLEVAQQIAKEALAPEMKMLNTCEEHNMS